jgi:methyltransferase
MVSSLVAYELLIFAVALERTAELVISKRHADASIARAGVECGASHYRPMVMLHTALLAGCALEPLLLHRPFIPTLGFPMLAMTAAAQSLRWWSVHTLGPYWSTRVIVVPGGSRVHGGPYRWFPHPNYVAVVVEGAALPLVHSAWITAAVFSVLNAILLRLRVRVEDHALHAMQMRSA